MHVSVNEQFLPHFSNPPLEEVAISVQFAPLDRLVVPEIGLLWGHYGERFSHVEQHPPLDPIIERFGVRPRPQLPNIQLVSGVPLPRIWFLDKDKRELLQIQQDRFIRNWRKIDPSDECPRYEEQLRPRFLQDLEDFQGFVAKNDIGTIKPNQCEVTYINHIHCCDEWDSHSEFSKVFSVWSNDYAAKSPYEIEDAKFQLQQVIRDDQGEFLGRLHVSSSPAFQASDDSLVFELRLIARVRPLNETLSGIMCAIDIARECVVRSFADITRDAMHKVWDRLD